MLQAKIQHNTTGIEYSMMDQMRRLMGGVQARGVSRGGPLIGSNSGQYIMTAGMAQVGLTASVLARPGLPRSRTTLVLCPQRLQGSFVISGHEPGGSWRGHGRSLGVSERSRHPFEWRWVRRRGDPGIALFSKRRTSQTMEHKNYSASLFCK